MNSFTYDSLYFNSANDLKDFMLENGLLSTAIECLCGSSMKLTFYGTIDKLRLIYRCHKRPCSRRKSILKSHLDFSKWLRIIYKIMSSHRYLDIMRDYNISKATVWSIKKKIERAYDTYIDNHPVYLGGPGCIVQVDESCICRRRKFLCPSSEEDDIKDTVWVIGAVDKISKSNFFIHQIPNRKINTLSNVLDGKIKVGSVLRSDGHPSYPSVARNLGLIHEKVDHSKGFITSEGVHTNNIESFWSNLKKCLRNENGVMRSNIDTWLTSYTFKKRYLFNATTEEFNFYYIEVLKIIIKE